MRSLAGSVVVGLLAGLAGWVFLESLDWATRTQNGHRWLLFVLPVAGAVITGAYARFGGRSVGGTPLAVNRARGLAHRLPGRMAPFVLAGTVAGHLFGASVGREGTALQMSAGLADRVVGGRGMARGVQHNVLVASLAGGFGAVFGVPWAASVFAVEVTRRGRAAPWCLVAAMVGHQVVDRLGYDHTERADVDIALGGWQPARLVALGIVCGLVATVFVRSVGGLKRVARRALPIAAVRGAVGGALVVVLALVAGRQYLGLSLPLADAALAGAGTGGVVWAWKALFTATSLGFGFPGGEVTPLFVIGATVASATADPLGLVGPEAAALGFVAVFAGAARTPLACAVMAGELFGWGVVPAALVCCVVARLAGVHEGLYPEVVEPLGPAVS